jgi:signal transduction histidine kinase
LAIVKRAVQWHHGEISVGRSPMGGARFTLTLPLRA